MTSFTAILNNLERIVTRKINGGAKFSEIKGKKSCARCNVRNRLKFGTISWKDLLCTKCKKMDIKILS